MSKFPQILAELRDRNGLTQAQLGDAVGLSRSTISMYEKGKRIPDLPNLEKFADYFNIDMDTLTGRKALNFYITVEDRKLLEQLKGKELRQLLEMTRDAKPEDIGIITELLERLKLRGGE